MKPIVIYSDSILDGLSFLFSIQGMSLFPFVVLREKFLHNPQYKITNEMLIKHETIHFKQQVELMVIPFYILYFLEYLIKLIIYGDSATAYKNISFEREAYNNDENFDYLNSRKRYNWIKLIFNGK